MSELAENPQPRCESCGRFLAYEEMGSGYARHRFVPGNEFGPEESEWECAACVRAENTEQAA